MRTFSTPSPMVNVMAKAAFHAGRSLIRDFGEIERLQTSCKGIENFASMAEQRSEKNLYEALKHAYPKSNFLTKRLGSIMHAEEGAFFWIVDPMNGAKNFLHGIPHFGITIALREKMGITAAVVYDPIKDEMFWSAKGCGTFLNQNRLRVSGRHSIADALLSTTDMAIKKSHETKQHVQKTLATSFGVRVSGSTALDLAYVAAGRYDGFFGQMLAAWDVAPALLLLTEAGGFITDYAGAPQPLGGESVIAGNEHIHKALQAAMIG